ncbi:MAG TPA: efflux transporter outer membrane subunit [Candidatus Acidoferrum sp.]|nr:efflux transporter outer membrane subunit [Candidatus Acidoferrum sp.]
MFTSESDNSNPARMRAAVRPWLTLFAVAALLLTGCVVGPKYTRPSVQTPSAYKEIGTPETAAAGTWKQAQPSDSASRGEWWKEFNDPQLNELEEKASAANQNIAAAASSFLVARALVREARSQYFPTATTNPSITNERPSPAQFAGVRAGASANTQLTVTPFTDFSLPADASWEPDLWGRVRNSVRANVFAAQASAADLANVRLSEQAELAVDYYELRAQDSLKQVFDSTVAAYQDSLDLNRSLYKSGLSSDEAVAQAEAQLRAAQAQDTNLGILRAQYEHAVAVLTGQPASTFSIPPSPLGGNRPAIPVGVPSDVLERRPDIAAAERAVAEANAQIGVAKAAYFPDVLLSATGGFGNSSITSWFTWPSRFWAVGPSLAQTIFDAGLRKATMEQYRATYDQTIANYRQNVLTAFQEVEDNLAALRILSDSIQQQDAAVDAAARSLQEATVRYKAGLDPYLNVISAQTILLNDEQAAVNFRMQQMVASVQLIKALGGDWNVSRMPSPRELGAVTRPSSGAKLP